MNILDFLAKKTKRDKTELIIIIGVGGLLLLIVIGFIISHFGSNNSNYDVVSIQYGASEMEYTPPQYTVETQMLNSNNNSDNKDKDKGKDTQNQQNSQSSKNSQNQQNNNENNQPATAQLTNPIDIQQANSVINQNTNQTENQNQNQNENVNPQNLPENIENLVANAPVELVDNAENAIVVDNITVNNTNKNIENDVSNNNNVNNGVNNNVNNNNINNNNINNNNNTDTIITNENSENIELKNAITKVVANDKNVSIDGNLNTNNNDNSNNNNYNNNTQDIDTLNINSNQINNVEQLSQNISQQLKLLNSEKHKRTIQNNQNSQSGSKIKNYNNSKIKNYINFDNFLIATENYEYYVSFNLKVILNSPKYTQRFTNTNEDMLFNSITKLVEQKDIKTLRYEKPLLVEEIKNLINGFFHQPNLVKDVEFRNFLVQKRR